MFYLEVGRNLSSFSEVTVATSHENRSVHASCWNFFWCELTPWQQRLSNIVRHCSVRHTATTRPAGHKILFNSRDRTTAARIRVASGAHGFWSLLYCRQRRQPRTRGARYSNIYKIPRYYEVLCMYRWFLVLRLFVFTAVWLFRFADKLYGW